MGAKVAAFPSHFAGILAPVSRIDDTLTVSSLSLGRAPLRVNRGRYL